jgi:chemotaxis signal transduction protein
MSEYLIFEVGERTFGISVTHVRQVVRAATLSVPGQGNTMIEGLLNLRGQPIPVLDLTAHLGIDQAPLSDTDYLLIVHDDADRAFAIRSNSEVQLVQAEPTEGPDQEIVTAKIVGLIRVDSKLVSILDPAALFPHSTQASDQGQGGAVP